ncbi:MAG: MBL fold metallo-hydrolase [Candidatus Liptonbacteria bacterium]|nr:MBL fold metallo-hydrolase [Candidatus Liptonbacteria bacterium]
MTLTKLGHCCLVIEDQGLRILTDPGEYSTLQNEVKNIDLILITHEHGDHLHVESLKTVLENNPKAKIITNHGVGKILTGEGIPHEFLEHGQEKIVGGLKLEGHGDRHADIYETVPVVQNTGYFISERLFYPGDALYNPQKPVEILALPVAGAWLPIADAVNYAKLIKPQICFPVHDANLKWPGFTHRIPGGALTPLGIKFIVPEENKSITL